MRIHTAAVGLLAVTLLASACGSDDESTDTTVANTTEAVETTAAPTTAPEAAPPESAPPGADQGGEMPSGPPDSASSAEDFDPHLGGIREAELREQVYDRQAEFERLDVDGDGFLVVDEYNGPAQMFADMDSDGDEKLSPDEAQWMMTFAEIPAGTFTMGTDEPITAFFEPSTDMTPAVDITVDAFEMSATEVTNAQYVLYLNSALEDGEIEVELGQVEGDMTRVYYPVPAYSVKGAPGTTYAGLSYIQLTPVSSVSHNESPTTGLLIPEHPLNEAWIEYSPETEQFYVHPGFEDWPVAYMKYWGAMAFAERYGLSLPTEAEWEYAASGGRQYDFGTGDGTATCQSANFGCYDAGMPNYQGPDTIDEFVGFRITVGSYPPNPYGVYDLSGNVWEWTLGWWDDGYQHLIDDGITSNPVNLEGEEAPTDGTAIGGPGMEFSHDSRVLRGGNWNYPEQVMRNEFRMQAYSFIANDHIGFRVVWRSPDVVFNGQG